MSLMLEVPDRTASMLLIGLAESLRDLAQELQIGDPATFSPERLGAYLDRCAVFVDDVVRVAVERGEMK